MTATNRMPRVALYARVSTDDKGQDNEVQLRVLRAYAESARWDVIGEFVDVASANDHKRRKEFARLNDLIERRGVDIVAVVRLDRAFRSLTHCFGTLDRWREHNCDFVAITQSALDTSTSSGKIVLAVLAAVAEMERDLISERTKDGLAYARSQGKTLGRRRVELTGAPVKRWPEIRQAILAGEMSKRAAAKNLHVSPPTIDRLLREAEEAQQAA
jgi:DNA invertase Pin-like site-specific DNA recombinase